MRLGTDGVQPIDGLVEVGQCQGEDRAGHALRGIGDDRGAVLEGGAGKATTSSAGPALSAHSHAATAASIFAPGPSRVSIVR